MGIQHLLKMRWLEPVVSIEIGEEISPLRSRDNSADATGRIAKIGMRSRKGDVLDGPFVEHNASINLTEGPRGLFSG